MRFIDEAQIHIASGHGGRGCIAFRREKYEPRGGPAGGDGGKGGDVRFRATSNLATLLDFRYRRVYKAPNGKNGSGSNKTGAAGEDLVILVPLGTIIRDRQSNSVLADLEKDQEEIVVCRGGKGGKGNAHFATARFQAPRFAQAGEDGEQKDLSLELKVLADVGIMGFPNVGKSSLIAQMSAARPKVADYAFTTLVPNLGVVAMPGYRSIVMADIPGLIKNAHRGQGLGSQFLRHIERSQMLVHLLNGEELLKKKIPKKTSNPYRHGLDRLVENYATLRHELGLYKEELLERTEILAINKMDLIPEEDHELVREGFRERIQAVLKKTKSAPLLPEEPLLISGHTGLGVDSLKAALQKFFETQEEETATDLPTGLRTESAPAQEKEAQNQAE